MRRTTFATAVAAALLSTPAAAQLVLERDGGVLGASLDYAIGGAGPTGLYVFMPSTTTGPLPLSLFDPADTRVLQVGSELFSLWSYGFASPFGDAQISLPLSGNGSLTGLAIHAQVVTLPGATTLVDRVSNRASVRLCPPGDSVLTVADAPLGLQGNTATALPDGDVLLVGGSARDGAGAAAGFDRLLRYRHEQGEFRLLAGTLTDGRVAHTATLLADGTVLVVGGTDANDVPLASAERIDPKTGAVLAYTTLDTPRVAHTATLLVDGRVLVVGGTRNFDFSDPLAALGDVLATTRIYDPTGDTWSNGPSLPLPRVGHAATRLLDGRVLVSGGLQVDSFFGLPLPSFASTARLFDAAATSQSSGGSFSGGRAFHSQALLADGSVLLVGGAEGDLINQVFNTRADSRRYTPSGNAWSNGPSIAQGRAYAQLLVAPGRAPVLVGGLATVDVATGTGTPADLIELFDDQAGSWSTAGSQLLPRPIGASALTDPGSFPRVLTTGEALLPPGSPVDLTAELFVLP